MVDGVYDSDPKKDKNATIFEKISYDQVLNKKLNIMDATAVVVCRDNNLPLRVFNLMEKDALINTMTNERVGTLVGH